MNVRALLQRLGKHPDEAVVEDMERLIIRAEVSGQHGAAFGPPELLWLTTSRLGLIQATPPVHGRAFPIVDGSRFTAEAERAMSLRPSVGELDPLPEPRPAYAPRAPIRPVCPVVPDDVIGTLR